MRIDPFLYCNVEKIKNNCKFESFYQTITKDFCLNPLLPENFFFL